MYIKNCTTTRKVFEENFKTQQIYLAELQK